MSKNELSAEEFRRMLKDGTISASNGKIQAPKSIFDDKEMLSLISDENKRTSAETSLKLNSDIKAIFIPGNVPSSKNQYKIILLPGNSQCCNAKVYKSKTNKSIYICTKCNKVAKRKIIYSLAHKGIITRYKTATAPFYDQYVNYFADLLKEHLFPINLGMFFIRDSKRIFDYNNASHIVQDILVKGIKNSKRELIARPWIPDDSMIYIRPVFLGYRVDPSGPGVIIKILPDEFNNLINKYI